MQQNLTELWDSRDQHVRIDREAGVLRGVKILGLESRNRRRYPPEALGQAIEQYEGAKVNVNHPKGGPLSPRDYQDRIGVIRNVSLREREGLFADFHFNPKHVLAEQLAWDAQHAPENVGFSHNVLAHTSQRGEELLVDQILRVQSVDLVADPATTRGLFEAAEGDAAATAEFPWHALTLESLQANRPDLCAAALAEQQSELARLRSELDQHRAVAAVSQRKSDAVALLREFELPAPGEAGSIARSLVSEEFFQSLLDAPDSQSMRRLVEQRAALIHGARQLGGNPSWRPTSRDQYPAKADGGVREFVSAIKAG